jgi:hypothetical protein
VRIMQMARGGDVKDATALLDETSPCPRGWCRSR